MALWKYLMAILGQSAKLNVCQSVFCCLIAKLNVRQMYHLYGSHELAIGQEQLVSFACACTCVFVWYCLFKHLFCRNLGIASWANKHSHIHMCTLTHRHGRTRTWARTHAHTHTHTLISRNQVYASSSAWLKTVWHSFVKIN